MAKKITKNKKELDVNAKDLLKKDQKSSKKINKNQDLVIIGIALLIIISIYLFYQLNLISQFESLPSPLYGGDYYYQLGGITHVYRGGNPMEGTTLDSGPGYFILYSAITGYFTKIFSFDPINGVFYFSFIVMIVSILVYYYFSYILLKNRYLSIVSTLLYLPLTAFPVLKYTSFTQYLIMPLFFISAYVFIKNTNYKNAILLAIGMGLASISHSTAFVSVYLAFFIILLYFSGFISTKKEMRIAESGDEKDKKIKAKESVSTLMLLSFFNIENLKIFIKRNFKYIAVVFIISFTLAQLYWFDPIFVQHAQTQPHYLEWNSPDWSSSYYQTNFLFNVIKGKFFDFSSILATILSILTIAGLVYIIFLRKTFEINYLIAALIAGIIGTFHYFLTIPVIHTHFVPDYIMNMLLTPIIPILIGFGILFMVSKLENTKNITQYSDMIFIFFAIIILINNINSFENYIKDDKWINAGKNPLPGQLVDIRKFVFENTGVNDVFLTTNELGFALNALTGAKLVSTRRAQSYAFMDMDDRVLTSAIILYGNDTKKKLELIKKYKIKYLYWDYYWIQSEYSFDQQGKMVGWFDPLLVFETEENIKTLENYNISYLKKHTWVDPALKGPDFKQFDLVFVSPQNYQSFSHPWKSDLDPYLDEIWSYSQGGQKIAVLYKFNV